MPEEALTSFTVFDAYRVFICLMFLCLMTYVTLLPSSISYLPA